MHEMIRSYRRTLPGDHRHLLERFRYVDAARKVVGVGSVGTRAWIVLMLGRDNEDPLFLQAKEAQASVLEPYLGKSRHANHGQRVVAGQRLMQAASDVMLGWLRTVASTESAATSTSASSGTARDRRRRPMEPSALTIYAKLCGWTLARATRAQGTGSHRRISRQQTTDSTAIAAFAETYADQNEADYAALQEGRRHRTRHSGSGVIATRDQTQAAIGASWAALNIIRGSS